MPHSRCPPGFEYSHQFCRVGSGGVNRALDSLRHVQSYSCRSCESMTTAVFKQKLVVVSEETANYKCSPNVNEHKVGPLNHWPSGERANRLPIRAQGRLVMAAV